MHVHRTGPEIWCWVAGRMEGETESRQMIDGSVYVRKALSVILEGEAFTLQLELEFRAVCC